MSKIKKGDNFFHNNLNLSQSSDRHNDASYALDKKAAHNSRYMLSETINDMNEGNTTAKKLPTLSLTAQLEVMELLLEDKEGSDVIKLLEFKDNYGYTTLSHAALQGKLEMVEYLVDKGAYLESKNSLGHTAFMIAYMSDHDEVAHFLAQLGANIEAGDNEGKTILHWACENGYYDIVEFLVNHEVDLELADNDGITPMMSAAINNQEEIIEYIISLGVDINKRDLSGKTAFQHALENNNKDAAWYITNKEYYKYLKGYNEVTSQCNLEAKEHSDNNDIEAFDRVMNYHDGVKQWHEAIFQKHTQEMIDLKKIS